MKFKSVKSESWKVVGSGLPKHVTADAYQIQKRFWWRATYHNQRAHVLVTLSGPAKTKASAIKKMGASIEKIQRMVDWRAREKQ